MYNEHYSAYGNFPYPIYTSIGSNHHPYHGAIHTNDITSLDNFYYSTINPHLYHQTTIDHPLLPEVHKFKTPLIFRGGFKPILIPRSPSVVLTANAIEPYYRDGRVLKQYLVMENDIDDNTIDGYNSANGFTPFLPPSFSALPTDARPNLGYSTVATATSNSDVLAQAARPIHTGTPGIPTSVPQNPTAPLQLGSGSLGYLRLPNGAVYLGSGSLGYVNDRQRVEQIQDVRNRVSPGASPLTFGKSP